MSTYAPGLAAAVLADCPEIAVPVDQLAARIAGVTGHAPPAARVARELREAGNIILLESTLPWIASSGWTREAREAYQGVFRELGLQPGPLAVVPRTGTFDGTPSGELETQLRLAVAALCAAADAPSQVLSAVRNAEATRRALRDLNSGVESDPTTTHPPGPRPGAAGPRAPAR